MKNIIIALVLMIIIYPSLVLAELRNTSGVGFAVGPVSGSGFSFRSDISSTSAIQFTGGILVAGQSGGYSVGLQYLLNLRKDRASRLYAFAGAGVHGTTESNDAKIFGISTDSASGLAVGVGFGWERFYPVYGMGFSFEVPLTFIPSIPLIMPLPQIGIHYYFK
jgi:hypothetical protein